MLARTVTPRRGGSRLGLGAAVTAVPTLPPPSICPGGAGHLEVRDPYADTNGSTWILCEAPDASTAPFVITSFLNSLQLWQRGQDAGVTLNATIQPMRGTPRCARSGCTRAGLGWPPLEHCAVADEDYRLKLVRMSNATWSVESCSPNPCQNEGKCLLRDRRRVCECKGHFTGLLCGLTECDLEPCVWGKCILTAVSFRCSCAPHYKVSYTLLYPARLRLSTLTCGAYSNIQSPWQTGRPGQMLEF